MHIQIVRNLLDVKVDSIQTIRMLNGSKMSMVATYWKFDFPWGSFIRILFENGF